MNRLWLLARVEGDPHWRNPWDMALGFVVRAATEQEARTFASEQSGDEGPDVWMLQSSVTCDELTADGEVGVMMRDFNAG